MSSVDRLLAQATYETTRDPSPATMIDVIGHCFLCFASSWDFREEKGGKIMGNGIANSHGSTPSQVQPRQR